MRTPIGEDSVCCGRVSANRNIFWMKNLFLKQIGNLYIFPLIFGSTLALTVTVFPSFDFSMKVTTGDMISFGLLTPEVQIVNLWACSFNFLTISSVTYAWLLPLFINTLVTSDNIWSVHVPSTSAVWITTYLSTANISAANIGLQDVPRAPSSKILTTSSKDPVWLSQEGANLMCWGHPEMTSRGRPNLLSSRRLLGGCFGMPSGHS